MGDQPATDPTSRGFVPVCAIGASAGGVRTPQILFRMLLDDLGIAHVLVVRLFPIYTSAMHKVLSATTPGSPWHGRRRGTL
jgi:two-component system CheB/CheR fusion protein